MRAEQPASDNRGFAAAVLLWLHLLILTAGAAQFAFAPYAVHQPLLAVGALALLTLSMLVTRSIPAMQRPLARQHWIDVITLAISVTALCAATGAVRSSLLSLYAVPLAGIAVAFGSWWLVVMLAAVVAALGLLLGSLTPNTYIGDPEFLTLLFNTFAPPTAVALLVAALIARMQSAVQRISDLSSTDALTGLLNLRAFEEVLQQEHRKAERFNRPYTVAVIDVDNLAQVNEMLGHDAGSQVLGTVASAITRSIRGSDVAARLGGDEFIVLLVEADAQTGAAIAQRIRNNVYAGTVSVANRLIRANVNVGTANFPDDHLYPKELMILADQRMQQDRELRRPPAA
ncbi:MAG TPA: GGDEF domain-containing protein [Steroidobacteraceae bacterium]|nr:GGDEF domain-containing protein [Steroidobacteraceae bacterium]